MSFHDPPWPNACRQRHPIEYSRNVNPSKGRRFGGFADEGGAFHGLA